MRQKSIRNLINSLITENINKQSLPTDDIELNSLIQTHINGRQCPHCNSSNVVCTGNYKNRKRYYCKECQKYYNDLTGTPFEGMHDLEKVNIYLRCMIEGRSIRDAANFVGISVSTSFRWRHKLLDKLNHLPGPRMKELVEVEEIRIPYSAKGQRKPITKSLADSKVSLIFACDRVGIMDSDSKTVAKKNENEVLARLTKKEYKLLCPSRVVFDIVKHKIGKEIDEPIGYYSLTFVASKIADWRVWMERFNGVATKYLGNYLHWFNFLQNSNRKLDQTATLQHLLAHKSR
jgi:transposase-like protein